MGVCSKGKSNKIKESCLIVQTMFYVQDEDKIWYIERGCFSHMTGDKRKFISLSNNAPVRFGDNNLENIVGKGTLSLDNGKPITKNVLYV